MVQNVRVSLFCPQQAQLIYDYNLYQFGVEQNNVLPSNIEELCDDRNEMALPIFEQEWTVNQVR